MSGLGTTTRTRLLAATGVIVALALVASGKVMPAGSEEPLLLRATFKDASPLLEGNDVRVGGVKVGTVESMRVGKGGAVLTLELDPSARPVHEDARLVIRPVSLLGERYIELDRGSATAPELADGARLGPDRTESTVDLNDVLSLLDDPTSKSLAALVGSLGNGMDGNGAAVRRAIEALAPAMTDTGRLTSTLRDQNQTLGALVDSMSAVASGVAADDGRKLDSLIEASASVLRQTEIEEKAFRATLEEFPDTLKQARRTLGTLESTADDTTPVLKELRPTVDDLDDIADEVHDFADAADPALKAINPVLEKADGLITEARPVARLLRQNAPAITTDAEMLDPITRELTPNITTVLDFVRGWALATNGKDGLSHYFRASIVINPYQATDLTAGLTAASTSGAAQPAASNDGAAAPGDSDVPASPLAPLQDLTKDLTDVVGGLLSPRTSADGGVTGLSLLQEEGALGLLLGGS